MILLHFADVVHVETFTLVVAIIVCTILNYFHIIPAIAQLGLSFQIFYPYHNFRIQILEKEFLQVGVAFVDRRNSYPSQIIQNYYCVFSLFADASSKGSTFSIIIIHSDIS